MNPKKEKQADIELTLPIQTIESASTYNGYFSKWNTKDSGRNINNKTNLHLPVFCLAGGRTYIYELVVTVKKKKSVFARSHRKIVIVSPLKNRQGEQPRAKLHPSQLHLPILLLQFLIQNIFIYSHQKKQLSLSISPKKLYMSTNCTPHW